MGLIDELAKAAAKRNAQVTGPVNPGGRAAQVPARSSAAPNPGARNATASGRTSYAPADGWANRVGGSSGSKPKADSAKAKDVPIMDGWHSRIAIAEKAGADPSKVLPGSQNPAPTGGGPAYAGGGGGGGGGGLSVNAGVGGIEEAQKAAQEAASRLEEGYEKDKAELKELYEFAETPEEKARIARAVQQLEDQRNSGLAAIEIGYDQARQAVLLRGEKAQESAVQESEDIFDLYLRGAAAAGDDTALEAADADSGLGALQGGTTGNDGVAGYLTALAPSQAALSRQLGGIRAEDIGWLADSLTGESKAHQADLERLALGMIGQAQSQHDAQVADRIFQERMRFGDQTAALQGDYRGREWDLEDQEREMMMRMAEMRAANARAAAAARSRGGRGGGGGGHMPTGLAQDLAIAESLGASKSDLARIYQGHGYNLPGSVANVVNRENDVRAGIAGVGQLIGGVVNGPLGRVLGLGG